MFWCESGGVTRGQHRAGPERGLQAVRPRGVRVAAQRRPGRRARHAHRRARALRRRQHRAPLRQAQRAPLLPGHVRRALPRRHHREPLRRAEILQVTFHSCSHKLPVYALC